jgi:hypothetical protein
MAAIGLLRVRRDDDIAKRSAIRLSCRSSRGLVILSARPSPARARRCNLDRFLPRGASIVIRMRFDCPETGEPLSTPIVGQWPWSGDELMSMHCPKCSKLHSFGRLQAVLVTEPGEHVPDAAGATPG